MLDAFQQRLLAIGKAGVIPREDWFMMCSAMNEARVPVDDDVQIALADAGFSPEAMDAPPEEMIRMVRHFMDELANMVSSPFEVIDRAERVRGGFAGDAAKLHGHRTRTVAAPNSARRGAVAAPGR